MDNFDQKRPFYSLFYISNEHLRTKPWHFQLKILRFCVKLTESELKWIFLTWLEIKSTILEQHMAFSTKMNHFALKIFERNIFDLDR